MASQMRIKKEKSVLIGNYYNTPQTSLVIFHFEPGLDAENKKLEACTIRHASIENKDLYIFDHYFQKDACVETREYFENASYSRYSYSTGDSEKSGEQPGYSMNTKERWKLFYNPPPSIRQLHELLSILSLRLNAEITTAPWELSHKPQAITPSVIVNFHTKVSYESMHLGRHRDCNPETGTFYGIPVLYKEKGTVHENCFVNGAPGKPWLVSVLLYATSKHFHPEYRMGTVYYQSNGGEAFKTNCLDGRLVLFEGDIFHSVEKSDIPADLKPWRVSYVLKLIINPREEHQNVKEAFSRLVRQWSPNASEVTSGIQIRV